VNLWELRGILDGKQSAWVSAVLTGWSLGNLTEDALRDALRGSGELGRWESVRLEQASLKKLGESMSLIAGALRKSVPGPSTSRLAQAHELLQETLEAEKPSPSAAVSRRQD